MITLRRVAWLALAGTLLALFAAIGSPGDFGFTSCGVGALLAGLALLLSLASFFRGKVEGSIAGGILLAVLSVLVGASSLLGMIVTGMGAPGRRLRVAGVRRLPRVRRGARGASRQHRHAQPDVSTMEPETREALARLWLADARAEHASVAAFERLAAELLAVGAPSNLVDRARCAALEEVGHATLCFALASAYADQDLSATPPFALVAAIERAPRPAPRARALERLAVESAVDGCLEEGLAARLAGVGAAHAVDPVVAQVLTRIAREEASHAELARAVLEWAVREAPSARHAVDVAIARAGRAWSGDDESAGLLAWGRVDGGQRAALFHEVRTSLPG